MIIRSALLSAALLFSFPAIGADEIEVTDGQAYAHEGSGAVFPHTIQDMKRDRVMSFGSMNDVAATYQTDDSRTYLTIYVTRVGTPDLSVWFDRVLMTIENREGFAPGDESGLKARDFVAPGFAGPSGKRMSYATNGSDIKATGMAIAQYGTYLVKVRVSSRNAEVALIDAWIDRALTQFITPLVNGAERAPYEMKACADALKFGEAKQVEADQSKLIAIALTAGGAGKTVTPDGDAIDPLKVTYCKDPAATYDEAIYRAGGMTDGYLLAYSDAGRNFIVGNGGSVLSNRSGDLVPVIQQLPDGNVVYKPFDKLPTPQQLLEIPGNQTWVAFSDRDKNVEINSDYVEASD